MEFVPGQDLEKYVLDNGPLPIPVACDFIRQAAHGLRHAYEHGLVHRDMKPSNLLVTGLPQGPKTRSGSGAHHGQIKILDFGLARLYRRRCTEAHALLGTVDYMAPEQARDARSVDIRADIYGLGGTLYWLLTGQRPFPSDRSPLEELMARQHEAPPPPRSLRPEIPLELDAIVCQMMARDPGDRYPTPLALVAALNDFLEPGAAPTLLTTLPPTPLGAPGEGPCDMPAPHRREAGGHGPGGRTRRVLVVSPRRVCRSLCRTVLEGRGFACDEAGHEGEVADVLRRSPADVVLIDSQLAEISGLELCRRLRTDAPVSHLKLILLAADPTAEAEAAEAELVCDDALPRAAAGVKLVTRVRLALRLKDIEERADRVAGHLLTTNSQLEHALLQRDNTVHQAQDVLIFAMAKMAELRGQETASHLLRMQRYVRVLAEEAMRLPAFASRIDDSFVRMIERCVLLHDIGKVAIPDYILLKPGKLDGEERSIMESHTVLGANILEAVARQQGACLAFLQMAIDVVRHHHEFYDGSGYPDGLAGDTIPLAARIVTICDVYDAMRSKLVYKPGVPHAAARRLLLNPNQSQFDPALLVAFRQCESTFEQVFAQVTD
jgi:response regulator RpfG family c-di-GMP phosphodiesterase